MVGHARFIKSPATRTASRTIKVGVFLLGAMWTLAVATARQTLGFQTTSLLPLIQNRCIIPIMHVALQINTLAQSVPHSQLLQHAPPRTNALTPQARVVRMLLV